MGSLLRVFKLSASRLTSVCKNDGGYSRIADRGSRGDPVVVLYGTGDADDCCGHRSDRESDHAGARNDYVLGLWCIHYVR